MSGVDSLRVPLRDLQLLRAYAVCEDKTNNPGFWGIAQMVDAWIAGAAIDPEWEYLYGKDVPERAVFYEASPIGTPSSSSSTGGGLVIQGEFHAGRPVPLKDAVSLSKLIVGYRGDPIKAAAMANARTALANTLSYAAWLKGPEVT